MGSVGARVEAGKEQCGCAGVGADHVAATHGWYGVWVVEEIFFGFETLVSIFFQIVNAF